MEHASQKMNWGGVVVASICSLALTLALVPAVSFPAFADDEVTPTTLTTSNTTAYNLTYTGENQASSITIGFLGSNGFYSDIPAGGYTVDKVEPSEVKDVGTYSITITGTGTTVEVGSKKKTNMSFTGTVTLSFEVMPLFSVRAVNAVTGETKTLKAYNTQEDLNKDLVTNSPQNYLVNNRVYKSFSYLKVRDLVSSYSQWKSTSKIQWVVQDGGVYKKDNFSYSDVMDARYFYGGYVKGGSHDTEGKAEVPAIVSFKNANANTSTESNASTVAGTITEPSTTYTTGLSLRGMTDGEYAKDYLIDGGFSAASNIMAVNIVYQPDPLPVNTKEAAGATAAEKADYTVTGSGTVKYTSTKAAATATVPDTVTLSNGTTYKVTEVASDAFKNASRLTNVTVGANVKTVAAKAFNNCKKLSKVTLGSGVTKLAKGAFTKTPKLKTLTVKSAGLAKASVKGALKGAKLKKALTVKVPKAKLKAYKKAFTKKNLGANKKVKVKK